MDLRLVTNIKQNLDQLMTFSSSTVIELLTTFFREDLIVHLITSPLSVYCNIWMGNIVEI